MGNFITSLRNLTRFHADSVDYYNNLGTDVVGFGGENKAGWMSFGWWEKAEYYYDACREEAERFAAEGRFDTAQTLLDVGCGCGEQDFFWKKKFPSLQIVASDITPMQIDIARKRAEKERADIDFSVCDACSLPYPDNTFDRVSALDCAFHFNTRGKFLREAFRVLKPGGLLILTDMLPAEGEEWNRKDQMEGRQGLYFPEANVWTYSRYRRELEAAGFSDIRSREAGHIVYKGFVRYWLARFFHPNRPIEKVRLRFNRKKWPNIYVRLFGHMYGTSEYRVIRAQKPEAAV